jgi:hypothetical protein
MFICSIYDLISNGKILIFKQQIIVNFIISIILAIIFTSIFLSQTYFLKEEEIDIEDFKIKLNKNKFKVIRENQQEIIFRGNLSYLFFVGDIRITITNNKIKVTGTRQILNKIFKRDSEVEYKKRRFDKE